MHRPVQLAINWEVRSLVGIVLRKRFVDVNAKTGLLSRMHESILKRVGMRKDIVCLFGVRHIFLYAEIVDAEVKMKCGGHAHGTKIGGPVTARTYLVELG